MTWAEEMADIQSNPNLYPLLRETDVDYPYLKTLLWINYFNENICIK